MQILFYISLAVTVLGFILAVVIFFLYDIPMIYAIRSGKQQQKAVDRLNRRSSKVGNFGGKRPGKASSQTAPPVSAQPRQGSANTPSARMDGTSTDIRRKIKKLRVEQNSEEISRPPVLQETEMLGVDSLSRMAVQAAAPKAETMPLRVEAPLPQKEEEDLGVTVKLSADQRQTPQSAPVPKEQKLPEGFFFQITEDTMVCDTEERI